MNLPLQQLVRTLGCTLPESALGTSISAVSTDTRSLRPGDCFVALRGDNFDGHDYIARAVEAGAGVVVTEFRTEAAGDVPQLVVPDTLHALGEMARLWRYENRHVPAAAIVGSNGKTTTKEMTAALLAPDHRALVTTGNLNNLVGVPRMLFALEAGHDAAVLEAGMNQPGELLRLVGIIQPQCVALVNITNAHVGNFGSQEALFQAKCDALRAAPEDAVLVMNADDNQSRRARVEHAGNRRVVTFGLGEGAEVRAADVRPLQPFGYAFRLHAGDGAGAHDVRLSVFGRHNVMNALCAAAIARFLGVGAADIAARLTDFRPGLNRSEVEEIAGWHMVKDYYNASPAAVENALRSLADFHVPGRRYAVLGDMLELGELEREYHEHIGRVAAACGLELLVTVGGRGALIHDAASAAGQRTAHCADADEAAALLGNLLAAGDLVLVKGSRLMKLERVYELLKENPGPGTR